MTKKHRFKKKHSGQVRVIIPPNGPQFNGDDIVPSTLQQQGFFGSCADRNCP